MNKKLAIIRSSYRPDGGAERIITRIITGLKNHYSLDVSIITRQWEKDDSPDVQVITCPKRGWFRHTKFKHFITDVSALLKQHDFDWVQSHERIPGCKIYRAGDGVHKEWLAIRKRGVSSIKAFLWDHSLYHKVVLDAEKRLFSHPELQTVICNSTQIKKDILKHYPKTNPDKLKVIYNGIDLDEFSVKTQEAKQAARLKLGIDTNAGVLLFVGSGFQRKGLGDLLAALAQTPQWQLLVVGKDKQTQYYKQCCQKLGITGRVSFVGMQRQMSDYYAACDLLVHPALYDPAPNVILEAMASGRGVVVSTGCGNYDLVVEDEESRSGFVYPSGDVAALIKILHLINEEVIESTGTHSRVIAENYSLSKMVSQLIKNYKGLS